MNQAIHLQAPDLLVGALLVLLVGYVLRLVFQHASPAATLVVVCVMIAAAAREVAVRPHQRLAGGGNYQIAGLVVALSSLSTVILALLTAVRPEPWFDARYAIPLMGIVLGSVLNAASLGLGGMDPLEAAKYQILLLFLLTFAGGLAAAGSVLLATRALGDDRQRLRLDRLHPNA